MPQVTVPIVPGCSDGDASHRPTNPAITLSHPPTNYLEKLGSLWMKDRGEALPGVTYFLDRLPDGYVLFQKPRIKDPAHIDRWLYGHPSHKVFDSPNRFYPHFKHLMENGNSPGCTCTICDTKSRPTPAKGAASSAGASRPTPKSRSKPVTPGTDTRRVDEEGTPDVYRNLIDKLMVKGTLDEPITQPMSMDWRSEQKILTDLKQRLKKDPQWVPRTGEVVLFIRNLPEGYEACWTTDEDVKLYNPETKTYLGYPRWEAGIVGQTPREIVNLDDLVEETEKYTNLSNSGLRVEPLPNINGTDLDKSISKQSTYIPLHQTRPFSFWQEFLTNVPVKDWDPTIKHALAGMAVFSLVDTNRFRGTWPEAWIYCEGIYVGSELFMVGDTVRLVPKPASSSAPTACTEILEIRSIRLKLTNLDQASTNDYDDGPPYTSQVFIFGRAFTTDASRSNKQWLSATSHAPSIALSYLPALTFHPLHPSDQELRVSFSRVLGRLYESQATSLWFPANAPTLSHGLTGIKEARNYARKNDQRIVASGGQPWYWGNSRADALDLRTMNGLEVSAWDAERDTKTWRMTLKTIDAIEEEAQREEERTKAVRNSRGLLPSNLSDPLQLSLQPQRLPQKTSPAPNAVHRSGGLAPGPASGTPTLQPSEHVSRPGTASGSVSGSASVSRSGSAGGGSKKRVKVMHLSSGDEDEIQSQTRIIGHAPPVRARGETSKKSKVMVMVGQ